jgi:hypothetical protein
MPAGPSEKLTRSLPEVGYRRGEREMLDQPIVGLS